MICAMVTVLLTLIISVRSQKQAFERSFEVYPVKAPPTVGDEQWMRARSDPGWFGRRAYDRQPPSRLEGLAPPISSSHDESPAAQLERHHDASAWPRPGGDDELQIMAPPPIDYDLSPTSSTPMNITEPSTFEKVTQSYEHAKDAIAAFFEMTARNVAFTMQYVYYKFRELAGWEGADEKVGNSTSSHTEKTTITTQKDTEHEEAVVKLEHPNHGDREPLSLDDPARHHGHVQETFQRLRTQIDRIPTELDRK